MRLPNRILAALLSAALIVAGLLTLVEVIAGLTGNQPVIAQWQRPYIWATQTTWSQGSVRVTCIIVALVGLALLVAELKPSKPKRFPVASEDTDAAYTRSGIAAAIRSAVTDVDGISGAAVTVKRRRVKVDATTAGVQPDAARSLRPEATQAATARLDALELRPAPSLSVRVRTRRR